MLDTPRRTALQLRREARAAGLALRAVNARPVVRAPRYCIRVANINDSVTAYDGGDGGNEAPLFLIRGEQTGLNLPGGIAVDAAGRTYVANVNAESNSNDGSVTIYAAGAKANASPLATIAGSNTGLHAPAFIALDGPGNIYAANLPLSEQSIGMFSADANGNVPPVRAIAGSETGLFQVNGLAVDTIGTVYVVNYGGLTENVVLVFAPGASGNVAPIRRIQGPDTGISGAMGIALDATGKLYVRNTDSDSVTVYAPGADGNVAPIATIAGGATGIFGDGGIAVDGDGTIYLTNTKTGLTTVTVYPPGSDGDVSPVLTINGPATDLDEPFAIATCRTKPSGCGTVAASFCALAAGGLIAFAALRWGINRDDGDAPLPADPSAAAHDNSQLR